MTYQWKTGSRHKVDANIAGTVCAELEAAGNLTAGNLVDISRPEDAPLHSEFEWNDSIAAEEWRKRQARNIIQSIVVVNETNPENSVRAYFNIEVTKPNYESISAIVTNEDKYEALKRAAFRELEAFRRKYAQITELQAVFDAIKEVTA